MSNNCDIEIIYKHLDKYIDQWDWETLTSRVEDDFLLANFNDYPWDLEGISSDATREVSLIESLILKSGVAFGNQSANVENIINSPVSV